VCYDAIAYSSGRARRSDGVIVCLSHCSKIIEGRVTSEAVSRRLLTSEASV
jgi:hypothetical protein